MRFRPAAGMRRVTNTLAFAVLVRLSGEEMLT
jgi:hypothetical protein